MLPRFWKHSHGEAFFNDEEFISTVRERRIYIDKNTHPLGRTRTPQGQRFIDAQIGDYFYLTHGNKGIRLLGQITGPVNYIIKSKINNNEPGWVSRPYDIIRDSSLSGPFNQGFKRWWTPNHNSTFHLVPEDCLNLFEEFILAPYFDIQFRDFNIELPPNQKTIEDEDEEDDEY
jgi:hypothetical protein